MSSYLRRTTLDSNGQTIPDCALSKSVGNVWLSGNGSIKPFSIEADIRDAGNYSGRSFSGRSYYAMNVFAKVQPGANIHLKINTSMFVEWSNCSKPGSNVIDNNLSLQSLLYLRGEQYPLISCGSNSNTTAGSNTCNEVIGRDVQAGETPSVINGENYYFLGTLDLAGRVAMKALIGGANASYTASVVNIDVRYKGNVLKLDNGDNQTYIVGQKLPKDLSVKVTEGETGAAVEGVDITFEILEPVNGAILSHQVVKTTDTGIAKTKLTLGSSSGTYKVKATCPADVCTSGVNEVIFTETAVTNEQATELQLKSCDSTGFVGGELLNPIKVRAFNKILNTGEADFAVSFSVIDFPSPFFELNPENNSTGLPYGFAETRFTLGASDGQYNVRVFCDKCLAKKEVFCAINAKSPASIKKERTKIKPDPNLEVEFNPSLLEVVYGKSTNICVRVNPPDKVTAISFESVKKGLLVSINSIPQSGCVGAGNVSLRIESRTDQCILQDSVHALLDGVHPIAEATIKVLIPTSEYAVKKRTNSSDCNLVFEPSEPPAGYNCRYDAYNVFFSPNINVADIPVKEKLLTRKPYKNLNFCQTSLPLETILSIDHQGENFGIADVIGVVGVALPKNCGYEFEQRVYIGACPIQTNVISVEFDSDGNIKTKRSDEY